MQQTFFLKNEISESWTLSNYFFFYPVLHWQFFLFVYYINKNNPVCTDTFYMGKKSELEYFVQLFISFISVLYIPLGLDSVYYDFVSVTPLVVDFLIDIMWFPSLPLTNKISFVQTSG